MKPHPRIRKTIKWGGAGLTVLLLVAWIGSGWWGEVNLDTGPWGLTIYHGRLFLRCPNFINFPRDWPPNGFYRGEAPGTFHLDWGMNLRGREIAMPLGVLAAPLFLLTALAWRLDIFARRCARVGKCVKCGYDRTGLPPDAVCPECGAAPNAP